MWGVTSHRIFKQGFRSQVKFDSILLKFVNDSIDTKAEHFWCSKDFGALKNQNPCSFKAATI